MNEAEWLTCTNPTPMRVLVAPTASRRKLLLFACALGRRVWHLLEDARSRDALLTVERYADGAVTDAALQRAREEAGQALLEADAACRGRRKRAEQAAVASKALAAGVVEVVAVDATRSTRELQVWYGLDREGAAGPELAVRDAARVAEEANPERRRARRPMVGPAVMAEKLAASDLLRDLFGVLPFRAIPVEPRWRTADVLALAKAVYEEQAFDRLPILADALQDAGCDNREVLGHCGSPGPHVRGCWLLDLLLGKE